MSKVLVAFLLLWLHCCEGTKQKLKKELKDKCKPKKIIQRKVENADCFEKDFKLLYLEVSFFDYHYRGKIGGGDNIFTSY